MSDLTGRVALVTGGTRGIGEGIARALSDAGAAVAFTGRDEARLTSVARDMAARTGRPTGERRVEAIHADVRDPAQAAAAVDRTVSQFGGLDILVNNAGVGVFTTVADMTIEQWHTVIDTNLSGVFYCCHAAIPHLKKRGGGWIINISSLAGKNVVNGGAAYCASKAGLNAFSEVLLQEVRQDNIRVSYIMPGSVATEFGYGDPNKNTWALTSEDVAQVVTDLLAMPARSLPSRVELRPSKPPRK
jgi:NAD(P)-dependent dehydrogenase (short-subunit alcohol dehydrogenase family)